MNISAVILAAGYSSRIGGFKPLMQLGGKSLLEHCAGVFRQAGVHSILVVTGHRAREVETEAGRLGLRSIHNPEYAQSMFSSVCAAVRQLSDMDGFFMLPVDIPLIRPSSLTSLQTAFDGRTVVYPLFQGLPGHPPLIPAHLVSAILAYHGQRGLKELLAKQDSRDVAVWDQGILLDADTPEDFAALSRRMSRFDIGEPGEALALATLTMPQQGVHHGIAVAGVAMALGRALNAQGCNLDLDLLNNSALLHDLAKGLPQHEVRGAEMVRNLGLGGLAGIVAVHTDIPPPDSGEITEKEVVCLADKLVQGSRLVSVGQRFEEKLALYAENMQACQAIRGRLTNVLALQVLVELITKKPIEKILCEVSPV